MSRWEYLKGIFTTKCFSYYDMSGTLLIRYLLPLSVIHLVCQCESVPKIRWSFEISPWFLAYLSCFRDSSLSGWTGISEGSDE
uniref:Uncharacterized protein n=1 Tax=Anguilla anguilla TaxID=7936 RepID=A0A0E9U8Z1_ANGAN